MQLEEMLHDRQAKAETAVSGGSSTHRPGGSARTDAAELGRMPTPVSVTVISRCEFTRSSSTWTLPPLGVNLMALDSRFHDDLLQPVWIARDRPAPSGSSSRLEPDALRIGRGPHRFDRGLDERTCGEIGWMSSRTLPDMIRLMSSRSSMSWVWARALRSMVSSPCAGPRASSSAVPQDLRPAEDRVQRRAQLVRQRGQELVFQRLRPLRRAPRRALALEEVCPLLAAFCAASYRRALSIAIAGLRCDAGDEALAAFREDAGIRVSEEEPADHGRLSRSVTGTAR